MKSKYFKKINALTLVQVLLALMIVAIVSFLFLTILTNNVTKSDSIAKINVAHSILTSAIVQYQAENFCSGNLTLCRIFLAELPDLEVAYENIFANKIKTDQKCGILSHLGCFAEKYYDENGNTYKSIDNLNTFYKVRFQNGISFALSIPNANCLNDVCMQIIIDTNGPLPPNKLKQDVFEGYISQTQIIFDL